MSTKNVGQKIKECRLAKGMTQEEIADMIGVSQNAIYLWENGKRTPKKEVLNHIYEALGTHDTIALDNPDDIAIESIIGGTKDRPDDPDNETLPSYSMTATQLNAMAYNVMIQTLHTCATKEEMTIVGYALEEFINEITGGKENE